MIKPILINPLNCAQKEIAKKHAKEIAVVIPKLNKSGAVEKKVVPSKKMLIRLSEEFLQHAKACENKLVRSPQKDIARFSK